MLSALKWFPFRPLVFAISAAILPICISNLGLAQTTSSLGQSPLPLTQDPQAVALIRQVLSAAGQQVTASTITTTIGTIRLGADTALYPIRIYTMGNDHVRSEIDRAGGTSIRILNAGKGTFTSASGTIRQLALINTIAERVEHIPFLSLLADQDTANLEFQYLGTAQLNGMTVHGIAVSWSQAATASDQQELLTRTKITYYIDPTTLDILQIQYSRSAEEDSNALFHYQIVYSNYRAIAGHPIPTTVTTYLNGGFVSELTVNSFEENGALPPSAFVLPEVTK